VRLVRLVRGVRGVRGVRPSLGTSQAAPGPPRPASRSSRRSSSWTGLPISCRHRTDGKKTPLREGRQAVRDSLLRARKRGTRDSRAARQPGDRCGTAIRRAIHHACHPNPKTFSAWLARLQWSFVTPPAQRYSALSVSPLQERPGRAFRSLSPPPRISSPPDMTRCPSRRTAEAPCRHRSFCRVEPAGIFSSRASPGRCRSISTRRRRRTSIGGNTTDRTVRRLLAGRQAGQSLAQCIHDRWHRAGPPAALREGHRHLLLSRHAGLRRHFRNAAL
jgi:hypothetical protein